MSVIYVLYLTLEDELQAIVEAGSFCLWDGCSTPQVGTLKGGTLRVGSLQGGTLQVGSARSDGAGLDEKKLFF